MPGGLLSERGLVLAKVETTQGVDALPDSTNDAILAANLNYSVDAKVLDRLYMNSDMSNYEHLVGQVVAKFEFEVEIKSNGLATGNTTDAPRLATLMRGCGYTLSGVSTVAQRIQNIVCLRGSTDVANKFTWAKSGSPSNLSPVLYTLTCTTAGGTGVGKVTITSNNPTDVPSASEVTVTTGTAIALGAKGGSITPTFTGAMTVGDAWQVLVVPTGVRLIPTSTAFETLTLYMWKDGIRHRGYAAQGSFTIDAKAGEYAKVKFTFYTTYVTPNATAIPANPVFDEVVPPQVESSLFTWGSNTQLYADGWTFDAGNDIQPRMDINSVNGYLGSRITNRDCKGGFSPEATLESDNPFWSDFVNSVSKTFVTRIGAGKGNQFVAYGPRVQTSQLAYKDRNGIIAYDNSMAFRRGNLGDDEVSFFFC